KVWAPLAVAIHASDKAKRLIAAADYQGWQRWVRSSATLKDDNQGLRFVPTRPTITVYDADGQVVRRFAPDHFAQPFWCDLQFSPDGKKLYVWPHSWKSRGLAGQTVLPADEVANTFYALDIASGKVKPRPFLDAISDVAISDKGEIALACWNGAIYCFRDEDADVVRNIGFEGPSLLRFQPGGEKLFVANTHGVVHCLGSGREGKVWSTDLNKEVPRGLKPWVANARATPIVKGL